VVENVFYFVGQFGGQPTGVLGGFFVRVLASGLYGHVLYTGLTGMGIAWFITRTDQRLARRLLVAGGLCLLAVLAHFLWNSPLLNLLPTGEVTPLEQLVAIPLAAAVKGIPFLVLVVLLVGLARRQERRWLQAAAAGELGGPSLTAEELHVLEQPPRRPSRRRPAPASAAPAAQPGHAPHPAGRRGRSRPAQPAPADRPDSRSPARGDHWIPGRSLSEPMVSRPGQRRPPARAG
jgi:protease PrsW